ncbi:MAG: hypothetical protein MJH10_09230 [Epibacterium sp.]|nr:hypothetical protein [Epibacterium sp.]NQX73717.1 hypothetical protein [Epibacterium sp.]
MPNVRIETITECILIQDMPVGTVFDSAKHGLVAVCGNLCESSAGVLVVQLEKMETFYMCGDEGVERSKCVFDYDIVIQQK